MLVLLADDHVMVRQALKHYLEEIEPSFSFIEAGTLAEMLKLAGETPDIDLILLDLNMPGMNGLAGLEATRARFSTIPVVILSGVIRRDEVLRAIECGAAGVIVKDLSAEAMINALRLVLSGERYIPSMLLNGQNGAPPNGTDFSATSHALDTLTKRERQVLNLLMRGCPNKIIAEELGVQVSTIKLHLSTVFKKIGASNRTEAVKIAMETGFHI